jgi:hypothetical protein
MNNLFEIYNSWCTCDRKKGQLLSRALTLLSQPRKQLLVVCKTGVNYILFNFPRTMLLMKLKKNLKLNTSLFTTGIMSYEYIFVLTWAGLVPKLLQNKFFIRIE